MKKCHAPKLSPLEMRISIYEIERDTNIWIIAQSNGIVLRVRNIPKILRIDDFLTWAPRSSKGEKIIPATNSAGING